MQAITNPPVSDSFFDLYNKGINERNRVNLNIKLPNKNLITYLSINNDEDVSNKKFLIKAYGKSIKLYNVLKQTYNDNTLSLIKCSNSNKEISWIKCDITKHINGDSFLLNFYDTIQDNNAINKINKIISTLDLIEKETNSTIAEKFLNGFIEEEGFLNLNDFTSSLY